MKKSKILITANSLDFLLNYKSLISKKLLEQGYEIYWNSPINELPKKKLLLIPKGIKYNLWISSRKGIIVFTRMILSYCKFVLNGNSNKTIISHTVYSNIAAVFTFYLLWFKDLKIIVFVSGFGPSRIRNSLRIRLLGRIYLMILRFISENSNILVVTLNFKDKELVQDFSNSRKVLLLKEAGITAGDYNKGKNSFEKKLLDYDKKVLSVGFFGRFLLEKGIDDFKLIVRDAYQHNIEINFFIGGSHDINNSSSVLIDSLFREYKNVKIYDYPLYGDFFENIDILLVPSYREGHPLYLLRSMAYGVVPIVYPNPGLSVDIIDNYNGIVTKYVHPRSMLSSLIEVNNNRNLISKISKNARYYASLKFQNQDYRDINILKEINEFINS
mgnify:CR=1 FL=1